MAANKIGVKNALISIVFILVMDRNGIPLAFDLFPGNESEKVGDNKADYNRQKKKKKKSVSIDQKQMTYYSEKYVKKQKHDRDIMVARAKDLIARPKKYDGYYSIVTSELKMSDK